MKIQGKFKLVNIDLKDGKYKASRLKENVISYKLKKGLIYPERNKQFLLIIV